MNGTLSSDPDGDQLTYLWFGPFPTTDEDHPEVYMPEGTYAVSLVVSDETERSCADTALITTTPCFSIASRAKSGLVQITWTDIVGTERYDVFRADENYPYAFEKIEETTSTYSTYLDTTITNETTYLYIVGALSDGEWCFSNVVSSHPTAIRTRGLVNYPPFIYSQPIEHGTAGIIYNYDVNATDPNADILAYGLLNQPDGMVVNSSSGLISWTPSETGTFDVTVEIDDGKGGTDSQSFTIEVASIPPLNRFPVADAGGPYSSMTGQDILFDGSLSSDPDNDPLSYAWDFGDNATGAGASPVHAYAAAGTYTVTLTVDDGNGGTATVSTTAVVYQPPTVSILATPNPIISGESTTLSWTSTDADSALIDNGVGAVEPSGSISVSPEVTTNYTITVTGPGGNASDFIIVSVNQIPTVSISASPTLIAVGETSTLNWTSTGADTVIIDQGIWTVALSGSTSVSPIMTTTYTITATGLGGTATDSTTITVNQMPTISIAANPSTIIVGESSTLTWSSSNADTVSINNGIGTVTPTGSTEVSPTVTTNYIITATGQGGTSTDSATIEVNPSVTPPVIESFTTACGDNPIQLVSSTTLSWQCSNTDATTVYIEPVGTVDMNASPLTVSPDVTTTYTLMVTGQGGTASESVTVRVTCDKIPLPEGSFGKQYEDLIPDDSTVDEYDVKRFSIITGLVEDIDNLPLDGVSVTMLGHSEYGTAITDTDGRFSLPVEGGSTMTLRYTMEGYLSVQRQVYVPYNDISMAEKVIMIQADTKATTIVLDGNPDTTFIHESNISDDDDGQRSCTLAIAGDTTAYAVDRDGNVIQTLPDALTVRATEYTVGDNGPDAMPAYLPPNVAYTYCSELSIDGVERVQFSKPVVVWVDNFLGFEVGSAVPVGYYDRDRGVWVPSKNGIVVKLLDTDSDSIVDSLDSSGDDQPDDLDNDGDFSNEVAGLADAQRYQAGATFWRYETTHFTPSDCNWAYGPPSGAISPNPNAGPTASAGDNISDGISSSNSEDDLTPTACYVNNRTQAFHEEIPIPGTGFALHYTSSRVAGYKTVISIPVSGDTVPVDVKEIIVNVGIAGLESTYILAALPNQMVEFVWDGMDYTGENIVGAITANVRVGFLYNGFYYRPSTSDSSFGQAGTERTPIQARLEIILWKSYKLKIIPPQTGSSGRFGEGWTLSSQHYLYSSHPTILHKGNGEVIKNNSILIDTIAGTGATGSSGDGGLATDALLRDPQGVAVDAAGNIYIADTNNYRIRKVDTGGIITTIAGSNTAGFCGDGGLATNARLNFPAGVTVDDDGNIYIADTHNHRIRKVDARGIITTIAGTGAGGFSGDGGPATSATLSLPEDVEVDTAGNIYIADRNNHRIRKVAPSGIITTLAGTGTAGSGGNGGLAINARLNQPSGVVADGVGNIYIADTYNHSVRKVDPRGIITAIPGTAGILSLPDDVAVNAAGNIYISDKGNHRIHQVFPDGTIATIAGTGVIGFSGDGGPAASAMLNQPIGVAVDPSANIYIVDNNRIRMVGVPYNFIAYIEAEDIPFVDSDGLGYIMDYAGRHKTTIDLNTGAVIYTFGYDDDMNPTSIIDRFSEVTLIEYTNGIPSAIVSPDNVRTNLTIDTNNRLTHITCAAYNTFYQFDYKDDTGLLTVKHEPKGNIFTHLYDDSGRVYEAYDQEGAHWLFTHETNADGESISEVTSAENNIRTYVDHSDATGTTSAVIGAAGNITETITSADGLTETKTMPWGTEITTKYNVDPQYKYKYFQQAVIDTPQGIHSVTSLSRSYSGDTNADYLPDVVSNTINFNGRTTTIRKDTLNSSVTTTTPESRVTTSYYDPITLTTDEVIPPAGLSGTIFEYDLRGRPTLITTGERSTGFSYVDSPTYHQVAITNYSTDVGNRVSTLHYDALDRLVQADRPDGYSVIYEYDANGNRTAVRVPTDTQGVYIDHTFTYNLANLNDFYTMPASGSFEYIYDNDRYLTDVYFPSASRYIHYDISSARINQIETPEGNVSMTYINGTQVQSLTRGSESITYGYDGSLITSDTRQGTLNQVLGYVYNNDFQLDTFTYAGSGVGYTYDNDGLLTGSGTFAVTRNAGTGMPEAVSDGTLTLNRGFNSYGEASSQSATIGGSTTHSWMLGRNDLGKIESRSETAGGTTANYVYDYDVMGRLSTVTKDGEQVEQYQYNANGSRTYERNTLKGTDRTFTYSSSNEDKLEYAGNVHYEFDADGFLFRKTDVADVTTCTYTSFGELTGVNLPDGKMIEYDYDPLRRRIARKVDGVTTDKYLWAGGTLLAIYDGSNNLKQRYLYADSRMPFAMEMNGSTYYLSYDQVGSLRVVTDASGNVLKQYDYDSFGYIYNQVDNDPSFDVPLRFAGGLFDNETGLIRFGARDYDPDTGRWTAKDPLLFDAGDTDLYNYCFGDPVNLIDPSGLKFLSDFGTNFMNTNKVVPGILAPTGVGMVGGASVMADTLGTITFGQWALSGFSGATLSGASFTAFETGVLAAATGVMTFAFTGIAWEVGVGIGSAVASIPVYGSDMNVSEWWGDYLWYILNKKNKKSPVK